MRTKIKITRDTLNSAAYCLLTLFIMRWPVNDFIGNGFTQGLENTLRVLASLCILLLFLRKVWKGNYLNSIRRPADLPLVFLMLVLLHLWEVLSTLYNNGNLKTSFFSILCPIIVIGLLFETMRDRPGIIIKGGMALSEILIYGNLLTILLFPDGMYGTGAGGDGLWFSQLNWLLDNKNDIIVYCLFACMMASIYRSQGGSVWRERWLYAASIFSIFLTQSAASMLGITLFTLLMLILKTQKIRFNVYVLLTFNIAIFFLIFVFRAQDLFSFLIQDVFHKTLTLTGRTRIWDAIWPLVWENPLLGLGIMKYGELHHLLGIRGGGHAHNLILNYLSIGGIPSLLFYLAAMFFVYRKLHRYQNTVAGQILAVTLFIFQILAVQLPYHKMPMPLFVYQIYFIAYYVDAFADKRELETAVIPPEPCRIRLRRRPQAVEVAQTEL